MFRKLYYEVAREILEKHYKTEKWVSNDQAELIQCNKLIF